MADGDGGRSGVAARLGPTVAAALGAIVLWNVDALAPVLFPLRLLVTFAHEAGHGLTATLTGGDFVEFSIAADGSGLALTRGGWRWLVLPAGYVGAAAFAAAVLVGTHAARRPRLVAGALAVFCAAVGLFFGWGSVLAVVGGLAAGAGFGALARFGSDAVAVGVLSLVGFVVAWSSLLDLVHLLRYPGTSNGPVANDAAAFGDLVNVGGTRLWAAAWLLAAAGLVAGALWRVVRAVADDTPPAAFRDR